MQETKRIELAIMVEGQNGLNWARWKNIAHAVEDLGFAGLYRSDHFTNASPPDLDSLELWVSLTWLASHTQRIEFGSLVSPVSFRHPAMTARMASAVDDLSGGRLRLGLGAGWQEREHQNYSFDLLPLKSRFQRFEEGLQIIHHLFHNSEPLNFDGKFYKMKEAVLLPRPSQPGGPPIVIGGSGEKLTLPLVVRFAAEWNAVFTPPERFQELSQTLEKLLQEAGRAPASVRRTLMTNLTYGRDEQELSRKLQGRPVEELKKRGIIMGMADQVIEQIEAYESAGVQRLMLQWLDLDDIAGLEHFSRHVLQHFNGS